MDCQNHDSRLVRKRNSSGHWMYTYQCLICGQIDRTKTGHGPWVPKPAAVDLEAVPLWSDAITEAAMQAAKFAAASAQAEQDQEWWDRYREHIDSEKWQALRHKALRRDNWLCQGCLEAAAEHVHHMTYERLGNELLCDLVSLCTDCHQICHPHRDLKGRELYGRPIAVH
jgi:hypothetical protein